MSNNVDNRMEWIRNLEDLNQSTDSSGWHEFEIHSECEICGMLDYDNGKILCYPLTFQRDKNGLYTYLFRIKMSIKNLNIHRELDNKGYYFVGGISGELISLLSLFFQCRFYLKAIYTFLSDVQKIKTEETFLYQECDKSIHPRIFDNRPRDFSELTNFLDLIRALERKKHLGFILACWHYARSLRLVGIDHNMVYVSLVSAIEALLEGHEINKSDNPLDGENFEALFKDALLDNEKKKQLKDILRVKRDGLIKIDKTTFKFKSFIKKYSIDFDDIRSEEVEDSPSNLYVANSSLEKVLGSIYTARSIYLHSGEPMHISRFMNQISDWHFDPSCGGSVDNRKFSKGQKLPYHYWFENLVRHCLLKYLED